ncbi:PREDICTED: metabotropic glutamate receptor-like [Priapulus caudatus]|uniref:Metabotropic glutamate receptor-like n=1 Tax=Priapulus caudatus TaxID=37621 RepID=A0ABM1F8R8_PRICU|nr:PREDICTED: metabotropic glutamate receptor-like [Priapulus caudatus]
MYLTPLFFTPGFATRYDYVRVGKWIDGLDLRVDDVDFGDDNADVPWSQCSRPCASGEVKKMQQGEMCCWFCQKCEGWQYLIDEFTCRDCPPGWWPRRNVRDCFPLPENYIHWNSIYAIVPMVISLAGVVMTTAVVVVFVLHNDTPVVRASGRELSYMLLSGILVCYLITFSLLAKPSAAVCGLQRFGVGFGFSTMYAALLTKTNRISRIFDSASKSAKRPSFISPRSQVVIALVLVSVQVVGACAWLIVERPQTRQYYPEGRREEVILKCDIDDSSFLISLAYVMLLIITCTVYAVKTRKIPENFNESKFIGFTMYTTCIVWLAFVPIYFGTLNNYEVSATSVCLSVSLSVYSSISGGKIALTSYWSHQD